MEVLSIQGVDMPYDIPPEKYGVSLRHAWGFPEKCKHIKDIDMDIFKMYILQKNTISQHKYINTLKYILQDG